MIVEVDLAKKIEEMAVKSSLPFNYEENEVRMARRKVTDLREKRKVILPKPLPVKEETKLLMRQEEFREEFETYVKSMCDKQGNQVINLTQRQAQELRSLKM